MPYQVAVNGRCLMHPLIGVSRYTSQVVRRLAERLRILQPGEHFSGLRGHWWEQIHLPPQLKRGEVLWSPANTGPLAVENQVLTLHDVSPIEHPEWFSPAFAGWYRFLLPRLVQKVRKVITVSQFSQNRILEILHLPQEKVLCIPDGVDYSQFYPADPAEIKRICLKYELRDDYFLVVGTLEPRKNLRRLLEAWEGVNHAMPGLSLILAGGASSNFRQADLDPLPGGVNCLGYVNDQDLTALYSGAVALILPSLYEGFGLPALEAMACGAPVVAARAGGVPEVVGEAGMYMNPLDSQEMADCLIKIAGDRELQDAMRRRGLERARLFSWDQTAQAIWKVLQCEV